MMRFLAGLAAQFKYLIVKNSEQGCEKLFGSCSLRVLKTYPFGLLSSWTSYSDFTGKSFYHSAERTLLRILAFTASTLHRHSLCFELQIYNTWQFLIRACSQFVAMKFLWSNQDPRWEQLDQTDSRHLFQSSLNHFEWWRILITFDWKRSLAS